MLLLMHVGADQTFSGFDFRRSDGAVAWADRARCYGNARIDGLGTAGLIFAAGV
jgi:hypothetical protein